MEFPFRLVSDLEPKGDQPAAIRQLVDGLKRGDRHQVLLGITGSGKTFTVANVIAEVQRPTLLIAHNKTLAAQLYSELRRLFPDNAIHYFVSYYDYYQPEAYVAVTDTYIEKDATINDEIDRLRHAATQAVLTRRDVVIVASVSCIFGIGSSELYAEMALELSVGQNIDRDDVLRALVEIQYERNDFDFHRGTFRVRGDVIEIFPAQEEEHALRVEFFGDVIDGLWEVDPLRGRVVTKRDRVMVFPSSHYVMPNDQRRRAIVSIREELRIRLEELRGEMRLLEAQRLEQRTLFDLEMLEQMGYCTGIENYSRHLSGRAAGQAPPTLLDYFPDDYLLVIDESHQTIPQLRAMYRGDRSRKENLVEHGFRLPSALDNRPLQFEELDERICQTIYVSATPGSWELEQTEGVVVEQIIRPTGLLDPKIIVRPVAKQVDDLVEEIRVRIERHERVLVTTLTKRMAEDLSEHFQDIGIAARYLHADVETLERVQILRELRQGAFDVLIGINLLREGLDLPEVSLVAILDADKEGFLRASRSLIQTIGRAARNVNGTVLMYGDRVTDSMRQAIDETDRRRSLQGEHNQRHGIVPRTVPRQLVELDFGLSSSGSVDDHRRREVAEVAVQDIPQRIAQLEREMATAAQNLEFERAAQLRDVLHQLREQDLLLRDPPRSGARNRGPLPSRDSARGPAARGKRRQKATGGGRSRKTPT